MNKSLVTNLLSILIIILGYLYQENYHFIIIMGVFALSGSITNWLAIHMLFERIPLLYGSGVILDKFEDIKLGIKNLRYHLDYMDWLLGGELGMHAHKERHHL